jgi:hypothetical protein
MSAPIPARITPVERPPLLECTYEGVAYSENPRVPIACRHPIARPIGILVVVVLVVSVMIVSDRVAALEPPIPANAPKPTVASRPPKGTAARNP